MKASTKRLITILEERIAHAEKMKAFLLWNEELLDNLPDVSHYYDTIDFDHLTHAEVMAVISAFGGKWEKTLNGDGTRIDYTTKREDGIELRCWAGEPPPSCALIEEEYEVPAQPAQKAKRFKLVCKEELTTI